MHVVTAYFEVVLRIWSIILNSTCGEIQGCRYIC